MITGLFNNIREVGLEDLETTANFTLSLYSQISQRGKSMNDFLTMGRKVVDQLPPGTLPEERVEDHLSMKGKYDVLIQMEKVITPLKPDFETFHSEFENIIRSEELEHLLNAAPTLFEEFGRLIESSDPIVDKT